MTFAVLALFAIGAATVATRAELVRVAYRSREAWERLAATRSDAALLEARATELLRPDRLERRAHGLGLALSPRSSRGGQAADRGRTEPARRPAVPVTVRARLAGESP